MTSLLWRHMSATYYTFTETLPCWPLSQFVNIASGYYCLIAYLLLQLDQYRLRKGVEEQMTPRLLNKASRNHIIFIYVKLYTILYI